jgi:hypothetical protein
VVREGENAKSQGAGPIWQFTSTSWSCRAEQSTKARLTDNAPGAGLGVLEVFGNGLRGLARADVLSIHVSDLGKEVVREPMTSPLPLVVMRNNGDAGCSSLFEA